MKYEYEAVSGDQSLFESVDAYDFHTMIVRYKGCIYSTDDNTTKEEIIAVRKVKEVKLPVVGDELLFATVNLDYRYKVIAINDKSIAVLVIEGVNKGYYDSFNISSLDKCTIIDKSKKPNSVNMVEEKWVPEVGDRFRVEGMISDFTCKLVTEDYITSTRDNNPKFAEFLKSECKFIRL